MDTTPPPIRPDCSADMDSTPPPLEVNCLVDMNTTPPPLGVNLTCYKLLNMTTMFSFCIAKAILAYKGQSTAPTTLDWVSGGVLAVV